MKAAVPVRSSKMSNKRHLSSNDTLCIYIPLNITANLIEILRNYKRQANISNKLKAKAAVANKSDSDEDKGSIVEATTSTKESSAEHGGVVICNNENENNKDSVEDITVEDNVDAGDAASNDDVIRRGNFNTFTDYIEAKYVQGLTITGKSGRQRDGDGGIDGDAMEVDGVGAGDYNDEEGSYYSDADNIFLDDSELVTSVAEQVYASTAKTKVEADRADSGSDDDNAGFFVNAGDLEMVEGDHNESWFADAHEEYEAEKQRLIDAKQKKSKPKKKSVASTASASSVGTTKKPITQTSKEVTEKRKSTTSIKESKMLRDKADSIIRDLRKLEEAAAVAINEIPRESLPRKPTTFKTPMTIPGDKKPGDRVKFENPRIPGQTLQVVVPVSSQAGSEVMVS